MIYLVGTCMFILSPLLACMVAWVLGCYCSCNLIQCVDGVINKLSGSAANDWALKHGRSCIADVSMQLHCQCDWLVIQCLAASGIAIATVILFAATNETSWAQHVPLHQSTSSCHVDSFLCTACDCRVLQTSNRVSTTVPNRLCWQGATEASSYNLWVGSMYRVLVPLACHKELVVLDLCGCQYS